MAIQDQGPSSSDLKSETVAQPPQDQDLFSSDLISRTVAQALPEAYDLRPLRLSDYDISFLECLKELTTVGEISKEAFAEQFDWMQKSGTNYVIVIEGDIPIPGDVNEIKDEVKDEAKAEARAEDKDQNTPKTKRGIVGTGTLLVERKFVHGLGLVGHIEDIAVHNTQRGKKLGLRIIQALDYIGENVGCYKTILDCSEANEGFYEKCGFRRAGLEMAHYYQGEQSKTQRAKV